MGKVMVEVTADHLKLVRRMKVRFDDDTEFGAPTVDPKRPYGNGDVYRDMADILGIDNEPSLQDRLFALHEETTAVIAWLLKNAPDSLEGRTLEAWI